MAVISGVVVGAAGEAVPNARVYVVQGPGPFTDVAALTDDEGRFALSAGTDGTYTVECRAEWGQESRVARATVAVRGGAAAELRIRVD
ncbi:carboxypeptidase-like regulatory domain-containing protein [Streptomyces sp. MST-110588]|uniref:carboxypeptidase-like regulatory domain-containing protein n=1 Tax=Streptomyces sp. MST-110588 TaxID=2833628 RepID=UPI001F5C0C75|nr:carboxypeptidase-like regulatory domain-containing protein [Streptomyces sp. MST-110588]UNO42467.1 carboxypeptidase regulatory-like domain-containing protein [Streptomyces sp. MST-110588]